MSELLMKRTKIVASFIRKDFSNYPFVLIYTLPGRCCDPECELCAKEQYSNDFDGIGFDSVDVLKVLLPNLARKTELLRFAFDYAKTPDALLCNDSLYVRWGVFDNTGRYLTFKDDALRSMELDVL